MKKVTLLFAGIFLLMLTTLQAQPVFYGLTEKGGNQTGTISRFDATTNALSAVYSFPNDGFEPSLNASPIQGSDGKIYGATNKGGIYGYGTIFSMDPSGSNFEKLHDFDFVNGSNPLGSLFQASNGILYGLSNKGGTKGLGTIYSYDPVLKIFKKLHDFVDEAGTTNGRLPYGGLVELNSVLYGVTAFGGDNDQGTIFSINLDGTGFDKLHSFLNSSTIQNGSQPYSTLLKATGGIFYGVTFRGGANNQGTIFSYTPAAPIGTEFAKVADFLNNAATPNGSNPFGSLIMDGDGLLYGLAYGGGLYSHGTVYTYNLLTNTFEKLHDFQNTTGNLNGRSPGGNLIFGANGNLFGMTSLGGTNNNGTIFQLETSGANFSVMHHFAFSDGSIPYGSLYKLTNNDMVGMANAGGNGGNGTVFSIGSTGTSFTKLHDFTFAEGAFPRGSLIQAKNLKLYGLTSSGGVNGQGTIFSYDLSGTGTYNKLHDFLNTSSGPDGANPNGSLVESANGKLYGMTYAGGSEGKGIIFSVESDGSGFAKIHDFIATEGGQPYGSLVVGNTGLLYGMTSTGGTNNYGTIFSFDPSTGTYAKLYEFTYTNGAYPRGNLILASDGLLYGLTADGGAHTKGILFSFNPTGNLLSNLHDFGDPSSNVNGASPFGSLREDGNGNLFGLTSAGGTENNGTIFSYNLKTFVFSNAYSFANLDGRKPYGSLTLGSNGLFYGMTNAGGGSNLGTLFSFNPAGNAFSKLQDFNLVNGASPLYGDLLEPGNCMPPVVVCPGNISATTTTASCTTPVSFKATLAAFCPATITYYLNFGSPTETEIVSGHVFPVGTYIVTAVAKDVRGYQSTCTFTITVKSGIAEICGNNIDDNCDGVIDENCVPTMSIEDAEATENSGLAKVKVKLSFASVRIVTVLFETKDASAKSPADFTGISNGQLIFQPGETEKFINIVIKQDKFNENKEFFKVILTDVVNATFIKENGNAKKLEAKVDIINSFYFPSYGSIFNNNVEENLNGQAIKLSVKVLPNPSQSYFQLNIAGNGKGKLHLRVIDIQGRLVEERILEGDYQQIKMGDNWRHGNYMLQLVQGDERKTIQLVKLK